jgi:hypothetical protein
VARRAQFPYPHITRSAHPFKGKNARVRLYRNLICSRDAVSRCLSSSVQESCTSGATSTRESAERSPESGPCIITVFPSPSLGGTEPRIHDRVCHRGSRGVGHGFVVANRGPSFLISSQADRCESQYDTRSWTHLAPRRGIRTVGQGCTGILSHRGNSGTRT